MATGGPDEERDDDTTPTAGSSWGVGIAVGLGIGVAFGVALDNIALGIVFGAAFAPVFAMLNAGSGPGRRKEPGGDPQRPGTTPPDSRAR
ncbi:hypothetical protein [Promicromonospora sp. NPDC050880]|uniref:hypothetical protein n=1 Tax=unclassified Promicromonospora TaxID=2647929 RepID=UPI00379ECE62